MKHLFLFLFIGILVVGPVMAQERGDLEITFTNTLSGWDCQRTSANSSWLNLASRALTPIMTNGLMATSPQGNCSLYSADYTGVCCPSDKPYCWDDGVCRSGGEFCENYNSSQSCGGANSGESVVGANSVVNGSAICGRAGLSEPYMINEDAVFGPAKCFDYIVCSCSWNRTNCIANTTAKQTCKNASGHERDRFFPGCLYGATTSDLSEGVCDTKGVITYVSKSNWTGSLVPTDPIIIKMKENCKDKIRTYPCPETAKLPFFGMFNFLVSIIAIGVIYFFYRRE